MPVVNDPSSPTAVGQQEYIPPSIHDYRSRSVPATRPNYEPTREYRILSKEEWRRMNTDESTRTGQMVAAPLDEGQYASFGMSHERPRGKSFEP